MKKFISVIAVLCLLCSFSAFSFADDYKVPVNVNISAGTFKISVPEGSIKIDNSTNGKTQKYNIYNSGDLPVTISKITVSSAIGWDNKTGQSFTGYKQFSIDVKGKDEIIPAGENITCDYTVTVPKQKESFSGEIATIIFTIAVDDSSFAAPEPDEQPDSGDSAGNDTSPSTPSVSTEPTAVTPTFVSYANTNNEYYKIAEFGDYSLLLKAELSDTTPAAVTASSVYADINKELSVPTENGSTMFFELSSAEFEKYCKNVLPDDNIGIYYLRDNKMVIGNAISDDEPYNYRHRYAIWVPNSSLPGA